MLHYLNPFLSRFYLSGFIVCVTSNVSCKISFLCEALPTQFTGVRLCSSVNAEATDMTETPSSLMTGERFLSSVNFHVRPKV